MFRDFDAYVCNTYEMWSHVRGWYRRRDMWCKGILLDHRWLTPDNGCFVYVDKHLIKPVDLVPYQLGV